VDELDTHIAAHAAALRRERPGLRLADAVIWASAQVNHRILVTRNIKDFPAAMPGIRVPKYL
jgi:predicted nucleic acid-binding protein